MAARRRGRGRSNNGGDVATDETSAEDVTGGASGLPQPQQGSPEGRRQGRPPRRDGKKGEQRKKRAKKSRGGVRSDVGVVPRHRDRRGKVEVIEPVAQDFSAFDVELTPSGSRPSNKAEGKPRPKRRGPRLTNKGTDDYRPPPPPGSDRRRVPRRRHPARRRHLRGLVAMGERGKVTTATLKERKQRGERIAALTAYDHLFARS